MTTSVLKGIDWQNSLDMTKIKVWTFAGAAAAGACTLTGVTVGSEVLSVTGIASGTKGNQAAKFESTITVANQIQQTDAGDLSENIYVAVIYIKD